MTENKLSRRRALARAGLLAGAALGAEHAGLSQSSAPSTAPKLRPPFRFCLNTATIRGQKLGIVQEIEIIAKAGYDGIEPWVESINEYIKNGGAVADLKKQIADSGLTVESAIGFPEWIVDDESRRAKGLERAKREMEVVAKIGGKRFAAPPAGATGLPKLEFAAAVERYRALLAAGDEAGIAPQLELWGFSKNLNLLGECVALAMETGHPKACVLADVYHLYKGGSDFHGIRLLGPNAVQVLHINDYPNDPPREKIDDSFRVFPGDGVAPLTELLTLLHETGGPKVLSLEVFNRKYWTEEPLEVAKRGLDKMKATVAKVRI